MNAIAIVVIKRAIFPTCLSSTCTGTTTSNPDSRKQPRSRFASRQAFCFTARAASENSASHSGSRRLLLCENANRPCGKCRSCHYALNLAHPDLHWYFPRPRLKDTDPSVEDVRDDYHEAIAKDGEQWIVRRSTGQRRHLRRNGASDRAAGSTLARDGRRKVFVIGDAERMGFQEGSEYAANAFLKLLEEPPDEHARHHHVERAGRICCPRSAHALSLCECRRYRRDAVRNFLSDPSVPKLSTPRAILIGQRARRSSRRRSRNALRRRRARKSDGCGAQTARCRDGTVTLGAARRRACSRSRRAPAVDSPTSSTH